MHVQYFEDMKCYSNYGKSNQGKEYRLSKGEGSTFVQCNSGFITNEMLCTSSSVHQRIILYCLSGGNFLILLLSFNENQWKKKLILSFHHIKKKKSTLFYFHFCNVYYANRILERWCDIMKKLGFGVIISSVITLFSEAFLN